MASLQDLLVAMENEEGDAGLYLSFQPSSCKAGSSEAVIMILNEGASEHDV